MITPEELMRLAIDKCRHGIAEGQSPFGCAIALEDRVIAVEHNLVWKTKDITAHAEVTAIRAGCQAVGKVWLENSIVATTCEPCPMCMAALHWARVSTVYMGASIGDAAAAGFNDLQLPASEVLRMGRSRVQLTPGVLTTECRELFQQWEASPLRRSY